MIDRRYALGALLAGSAGLMAGPAAARGQADRAAAPVPASDAAEGGDGRDAIEILAEYMLDTRAQDLPHAVLEMTRQQLLDTLAVGLAGWNEQGVRQLLDVAAQTGGRGESAVWGTGLRLPAHDAARINAVMAHALEFDDTFGPGYLHPSAVTFPAGLAVAELAGQVSGREFLASAALAIDIACRVSVAGQPGVDGFATGWHNTALVGYLASALLAGRLLKLDVTQLVHAAGIACHQAAGTAQAHLDGALAKRLGAGFASSAGVLAARLAARGATGSQRVLEGEKGWFRQYHHGHYSRALLLDNLGQDFPALMTSFKPWPSCRGSHTSVDAALQLVADHALRPQDIAQVTLYNGPAEYPFLSTPVERKRRPQSPVEAQFSIPWAVAAAFAEGKVGIAHFTPQALTRPDLQAMVDRIVPRLDDGLVNPSGGPGGARVAVVTRGGRSFSRQVTSAKGDPDTPMSAREVRLKFDDCIDYAGLSPAQGEAVRAMALGVYELDDVARLATALSVSR